MVESLEVIQGETFEADKGSLFNDDNLREVVPQLQKSFDPKTDGLDDNSD